MVQFETLACHPEWVGVLARWHFAEWQRFYPSWTIEAAQEELTGHGDPNRIPLTLVAVEASEPVGSVSLVERDLSGWDHLKPWLASLYVRADRRGQGIGKLLVDRAVAEARRLGFAEVYLFTPGQQAFYAALGWRIVAQTAAAGEPVSVMSIRL
jgi:predicted N-acetyltransferase YhbS